MRLKTFVTSRKEEYLQVGEGGGAFRVSSINLPPLSGEYISFLPLRQLFHLYNPLHIFFLRFFPLTLPSSPFQNIFCSLFSNSSSSSHLIHFLHRFPVLFPLQSSFPLCISYSGFPDASLLPSLIVFLSFLFPQMSHSLAGWGGGDPIRTTVQKVWHSVYPVIACTVLMQSKRDITSASQLMPTDHDKGIIR
jgi:hypothetical protein